MGNRKNLVLGGKGTIGHSLCLHLKAKGEDVVSLDLKENFDLRNQPMDEFKNMDFVWFLAWDVGGFKFLNDEKNRFSIISNNTLICQNVFSFLGKYSIPFMFASSQLAAPNTPYGVTKLLGEEWTRILGGKVAKFWNVYGWETPGERSHVIPDLILQALTKSKIELMSNGQETRQFIYMDDCVNQMAQFRDSDGMKADITSGKWISISEVAAVIGQMLQVPVVVGTKSSYSLRIEPAANSFNFIQQVGLEEGISKVIVAAKSYLGLKP